MGDLINRREGKKGTGSTRDKQMHSLDGRSRGAGIFMGLRQGTEMPRRAKQQLRPVFSNRTEAKHPSIGEMVIGVPS